jgi:16S rRNA (uracil1498-N3)-methyltransferase
VTHRFFIPTGWIQQDQVSIEGSVVHQIRDVLRMTSGDMVTVLDDSGWEYQVRLTAVEYDSVTGAIQSKVLSRTEPRTKIALYQSLLKGDKFEWVLQKGTELGIVEFNPMVSDRCVVGSVDDVSKAKVERWERIVLEAAEQSERARLPRVQPPVLFAQACERARRSDLALLFWEEETKRTLRSMLATPSDTAISAHGKTEILRRPFSISIFVGPEGGFAGREADLARRYGIAPVSLGPRILRADTAALAAVTAILYQYEDM